MSDSTLKNYSSLAQGGIWCDSLNLVVHMQAKYFALFTITPTQVL